jgi:hypothetical protein
VVSHRIVILKLQKLSQMTMKGVLIDVAVVMVTLLIGKQLNNIYQLYIHLVWFMVFNPIFNHISVISWRSVLSAEEAGVHGENHRPVASH